jgi:intracellular sulfur oxidation DsrE/DsrF family protein
MSWLPLARRSFLSHIGTGAAAVFGAALAGGPALQAQSAGSGPRQPKRYTQDDWLDQLPGQHRLLLDTTTPNGLGSALLYANNFLRASEAAYGLKDSDSAVVIVVRHFSTVFAYNDAIWAKYGAVLSQRINFNDPQTNQPPKINVYNSASHVGALPSLGNTLDAVLKRGVHLAVCQMATRLFSAGLAQATGGTADAVYNEVVGNLVANSHIVPAGIVALSRAQERGYTFASVV